MIPDYFSEYQLKSEGGYILGVAHYILPEDLERFDYDPEIIDPILDIILGKNDNTDQLFNKAIRNAFEIGKTYSRAYISFKLEKLFTKFNINKSTKATGLSDYCHLSGPSNVGKNGIKLKKENRPKGFVVIDYLFSKNSD